MSFLKQPRSGHQTSVPHRRDAKKRRERSEKELEEISAFFLQKDVSGKFDVQGSKRPRSSGLSRLGEGTGHSAAYESGRHESWSPSKIEGGMDDHLTGYNEEHDLQRDWSKANTYVTWSPSHLSPSRSQRPHPTELQRSSTPATIRDALVRSGVFDNTGILHETPAVRGNKQLQPEDPLFVCSNTAEQLSAPAPQPQAIRIVRYHDRGIMASDDASLQDAHSRDTEHTSTRNVHEDELSTTNPKSTAIQTDVARNAESSAEPTATSSGNNNPSDLVGIEKLGNQQGDGDDTIAGPSRPVAPKSTLVSKLEAITDGLVRDDFRQPAVAAMHVIEHRVNIIDETSFQQSSVPTSDQALSSRPTILQERMRQAQYSLPVLAAQSYPSGSSQSPLIGVPASSIVSEYSATAAAHDERFSYPIAKENSTSVDSVSTRAHPALQTMHDYIVQLEQEVRDRPQEIECNERHDDLEEIDAEEPHAAFLGGADEHIQPFIDPIDRDYDRAPCNASHHAWGNVATLEEDDEQRFLSSFWKPNRYTI